MEFIPSLFSTRVVAGRRTFFFDVRATKNPLPKNEKPYIKITEATISKEGERTKIYLTIFPEEMAEFKEAINQVIDFATVKAENK